MDYPYVDMHCDTLFRAFYPGGDSFCRGEGQQSLMRMCDAGQLVQFFAIFFPPASNHDYLAPGCPTLPEDQVFYDMLRGRLLSDVAAHADRVAMAGCYDDIAHNRSLGLASAVLTLEDGRLVGGSMEKLHELYEQGVRAIALTWNFANCFGAPNSRDPQIMRQGLTPFGREAIGEMNRLGMLVDVSHLSDGGFYDVLELSSKPFIASHSNCRALTDHPRNLTDDMIRRLSEAGGVSGLNLYSCFLHPDPTAADSRVEDMVRHVLHFLAIGGEDCLGIGTDFDGCDGNMEISHPEEMDLLFHALKKQGVTERQLDKIARDNVLRVIRDAMR